MDSKNNIIYFNNNRSTRTDKAVVESMSIFMDLSPSEQKNAIKLAYQNLAKLLACETSNLVISHGTTHAIELALHAIVEFSTIKKPHIITTVIEHPAVLNACKTFQLNGAELTYLPVNREGLISTEELKQAIQKNTILVSVMAANNETGVLQPLEEISAICKQHQLLFFSDASQFVGKMRTDVSELCIDVMAFGAHKMYGPQGIGALYISNQLSQLKNIIEQNNQPSPDSHLIVGFGEAAELSLTNYWETNTQVSKLKNYFEHQLLDIDELRINGSTRHRLFNTSNLTFPKSYPVSNLLTEFEFAHNLNKASHVLHAMGLSPDEIKNSYRFSFGKDNTLEEVKTLVDKIMAMKTVISANN